MRIYREYGYLSLARRARNLLFLALDVGDRGKLEDLLRLDKTHHSTLGLRVIKKKKKVEGVGVSDI